MVLNLLADFAGAVIGSFLDPFLWAFAVLMALKARPSLFLLTAAAFSLLVAAVTDRFSDPPYLLLLALIARTVATFGATWLVYWLAQTWRKGRRVA